MNDSYNKKYSSTHESQISEILGVYHDSQRQRRLVRALPFPENPKQNRSETCLRLFRSRRLHFNNVHPVNSRRRPDNSLWNDLPRLPQFQSTLILNLGH